MVSYQKCRIIWDKIRKKRCNFTIITYKISYKFLLFRKFYLYLHYSLVFLGHNWIAQIVLTTHIKQISVALLVIVIVANFPLEIKTKEDKLEAPITIREDLLHHLIKDLD